MKKRKESLELSAFRPAGGKGQSQGQPRRVLPFQTGRRPVPVPVLRVASSSSPNMDTAGREDRWREEGTGGDRASEEEEEGEEGEEGDVSISAGPLE